MPSNAWSTSVSEALSLSGLASSRPTWSRSSLPFLITTSRLLKSAGTRPKRRNRSRSKNTTAKGVASTARAPSLTVPTSSRRMSELSGGRRLPLLLMYRPRTQAHPGPRPPWLLSPTFRRPNDILEPPRPRDRPSPVITGNTHTARAKATAPPPSPPAPSPNPYRQLPHPPHLRRSTLMLFLDLAERRTEPPTPSCSANRPSYPTPHLPRRLFLSLKSSHQPFGQRPCWPPPVAPVVGHPSGTRTPLPSRTI